MIIDSHMLCLHSRAYRKPKGLRNLAIIECNPNMISNFRKGECNRSWKETIRIFPYRELFGCSIS